MGAIEIILLISGLAIFILSFLIPEKNDKVSKKDQNLGYELIGKMVDEQLSLVSTQIETILDEKNQVHMERIERRMERLSNEKIMAVGEYSDTVLGDIKKSHDEVVFLYDMLNSKHKVLKEFVEKIDTKNMEQTKKNNQEIKMVHDEIKKSEDEFLPLSPKVVEVRKPKTQEINRIKNTNQLNNQTKVETNKNAGNSKVAIQFSKNTSMGQNSNRRILQLHKEGKSNMVIAKELGLGIGEVKLVIDLFKGI